LHGENDVATEMMERKESFVPKLLPPNAREPVRFRLLVGICAAFVAAVGIVALLGWVLKLTVLISLGEGMIPVAPSTAVLFVLYAIAVFVRAVLPYDRRACFAGLYINSAGALMAAVLLVLSLLGIRTGFEHLGFHIVNKPGELQAGYISPITALCFLLSSLSYFLSLPFSCERDRMANIAWWIACGVIATGATLVLAYFYGTPVLYGSTFIPPAALTSIAFVALGTALMALATPHAWPARPNVESTTRASYTFLLVFLLLAAGIVVAGFFYYRHYEMRHRTEVEHQLTAIADLKVAGISSWRKERLGDAELFYKNRNFSGLVRRYLQKPENGETRRMLQTWLQHIKRGFQYDRVFLLDAACRERLSAPEAMRPISNHLILRAAEVLRAKEVAFVDFYRNEVDRRIYLALLVPILDYQDDGRAIGVLVMRIDPDDYFYPFLQRWPTVSDTAETLLVKREGNEVLFLNELRFQKKTALKMRRSLGQKELPAAQAVLGKEGIMEGVDYRGVPVIADVRAVPGSPWFLVSRMDISEVYGPLREKLWQTVGLVIALLITAGAAFGMVWRQQLTQFYRVRYEATAAIRASEVRYRRLFEAAKDGILIIDADTGMVADVNPFFVEMMGLQREVFLGKKIWELDLLKNIFVSRADFEELQQKEYIRYEDRQIETADGRRIDVELVGNVYKVNNARVIQCNIRDVTERKRVEDKLKGTLTDLQRSNKELEQFAYVASHDLQEPLRMVASYTQLLAQRYEGRLDDKARKYINYAVDGAVRMQLLINDLLLYSRVNTQGKPLETIDSNRVLGEAIRNLSAAIEESRAVITNDDLPTVRGDATQLQQVLQNLIGNAIKFRGPDSPHIHVGARDLGKEWRFSVKDNGIGIDKQYAEQIFVIFQRLHTRQEYPGTGIGLAVCKRIVERHGGRIWVESEPGKGCMFYFTLPK
jgi:PAS domain S-box-containing protein